MKEALRKVLSSPAFWIIIIYMLVPVDLIEDSIPVAGVADDALVTLICLALSNLLGNKNS